MKKNTLTIILIICITIFVSCNNLSNHNSAPLSDSNNPNSDSDILQESKIPSCDTSENNYTESSTEIIDENINVSFTTMTATYRVHRSGEALVNAADLVFIGRVVDIEFEVLDERNGQPVDDETPYHSRMINTIYTVEVIDTHKGDVVDVCKFRISGGMPGYREGEQRRVVEEHGAYVGQNNAIFVWDLYYKVKCNIGQCYLFALIQFPTALPTIINLDQAVFYLNDPTRKNYIGHNYYGHEYYTGTEDENGRTLISAIDVISAFGDDVLTQFQEDWNENKYN